MTTTEKIFIHKADKSRIPTCNILGVNIAAIDMQWLVDYLDSNIRLLSGDYICVSNVHTTVTAYEDPEYLKVQNGGIMAIPDGGPLSSVGQKRGFKNMKRTTGPSLMGEIFEISIEKGYRHYFYGSTDETLEKLYAALIDAYPGIKIAGMYSPPFRFSTGKPEEFESFKQYGDVRICSDLDEYASFVSSIQTEYFADNIDTPCQWIYYPDPKLSYHRILVRHNFCPNSKGYWTETNSERIDMEEPNNNNKYMNQYAYPLNTIHKPEIMKKLLSWSKEQGVIGLGRWGEHQHYNSDVTVDLAMKLVQEALK